MVYKISNGILDVEIDDLGAELKSIKKTGDSTEYLWQGNEKYWTGRAYNLFPLVGRLIDNKYTYRDKTYELGIHGFIRHTVLSVQEVSDKKIVFITCENEQTLKNYPFEFVYKITYRLEGNTLHNIYEVENSGKSELIFGLGGHPGFNVPLDSGGFEDWYIEFACQKSAKRHILSENHLMTDDIADFEMAGGTKIPLRHNLFDNDAIVLSGMCEELAIKSDKSQRQVKVSYPDMKYLGLWHAAGTDAPFVCIEPWDALPDFEGCTGNLADKRGMTVLRAGESYKRRMTVEII